MAEYIDRDAIYTAFANACTDVLERASEIDYIAGFSYELVIKILDNIPTVNVAPVVHGRWIGAPLCGNDNCRCSECGSWHNIHANLRGEIMQKYCPYCGAKMDGGDSDG